MPYLIIPKVHSLTQNMRIYKVVFYINEVPIEGGEILLHAVDIEQAWQVFRLHLNTGQGIPSIWDSYSEPIEIKI